MAYISTVVELNNLILLALLGIVFTLSLCRHSVFSSVHLLLEQFAEGKEPKIFLKDGTRARKLIIVDWPQRKFAIAYIESFRLLQELLRVHKYWIISRRFSTTTFDHNHL